MSDNNDKKYNPTLARGYSMSRGFWSPVITTEDYENIMKHVELGGRLVFKLNKTKTKETTPDGYFEFIPAEKVKEMSLSRQAKQSDDI
jgi:hypothetical protein